MILITLDEALTKIQSAAVAYEALRSGLGRKIIAELDDASTYILRFPESYPLISRNVRKLNLTVIPFQLFYALKNKSVVDLGLLPARMSPRNRFKILTGRLKGAATAT